MQKTERKKWKWSLGLALAVVVYLAVPQRIQAAENKEEVSSENINEVVTSKVEGENGGIIWSYDVNTKTLTVSGEDNSDRWSSPFTDICRNYEVKRIKFEKCKLYGGGCSYLFKDIENVNEINLTGLDTKEATRMECMFSGCSSLERLDMTNFDTSNV